MTETTPNNLPLKKTHPFNLVIIGQFVRFGPREFPGLSKAEFFGGSAATLLITVTVTVLLQNALGERLQALPGTAQNVLMSALFLAMLSSRHSLRGQSLTIAVNKMIGSAFGCTAIVLGINLYETTQRQKHAFARHADSRSHHLGCDIRCGGCPHAALSKRSDSRSGAAGCIALGTALGPRSLVARKVRSSAIRSLLTPP